MSKENKTEALTIVIRSKSDDAIELRDQTFINSIPRYKESSTTSGSSSQDFLLAQEEFDNSDDLPGVRPDSSFPEVIKSPSSGDFSVDIWSSKPRPQSPQIKNLKIHENFTDEIVVGGAKSPIIRTPSPLSIEFITLKE